MTHASSSPRTTRLALVLTLLVASLSALASPAWASESRGGWKTCPSGTQVVISSDVSGGLVTHKFSTALIGSGDAKVYSHAFGPPPLGDTNVTYTWRSEVWWQVHAKDTTFSGRTIRGDITGVTVFCMAVTASAASGSQKAGGYKSCPSGQYVWVGLQAWGDNLVRWSTSSNSSYKNVRTKLYFSDSIPTVVVPTWRQSAYWKTYNWGSGSRYVSSKAWCSSTGGTDWD